MDASLLAGWENFYILVGSAAGGLTGLTFILIALIRDVLAESGQRPASFGAFVTPTIVHFSGVLALSAYLSMPHQGPASLSAGFAVGGLTGFVYSGVVAAKMRRPVGNYVPVLEDWVWNVMVPAVIYAGLFVMSVVVLHRPTQTLYAVGAIALLLLFVGIRNAWDLAVWLTVKGPS